MEPWDSPGLKSWRGKEEPVRDQEEVPSVVEINQEDVAS